MNNKPYQLNPAEFKPWPCECGSTEWEPIPYVEYAKHRFSGDILRVKKDRDRCSNPDCRKIRSVQ